MHIFIHIHKSGGSTLMRLLEKIYADQKIRSIEGKRYRASMDEFLALPPEEMNSFDLLKGHQLFGVHAHLRKKCSYFAMLREPVSRTVSLYNYLKEINLYPELNAKKMDIRAFLESGLAFTADNGMTRFISGVDKEEVPYGTCESWMVEKAKSNIESHFAAVGLQDRFDESLLLFEEQLGWQVEPLYLRRNVTKKKVRSVDALTDAEQNFIRDFCACDLHVYTYAQSLFESMITEKGDAFTRKAAAFKRKNADFQDRIINENRGLIKRTYSWIKRKWA